MYTVKLKQNLSKLTHNDKVIAEYIGKNLQDQKGFTSYDISNNLKVSQASVIRFSKKLGYDTFQDLVADIQMDEEWEKEINPKESTIETFEKIKYSYNYGLDEVLKHNTVETFEQAVAALDQADSIYCYGAQTSGALTEVFTNRLLEIGKKAFNIKDTLTAQSILRNLGREDVLFVISATGETKMTLKLVKTAADLGIKVISVTGSQENTISKLSTYSLRSSVYRIYTNMFSIINRCTQLYLLDCLFISIYKKNPSRYKEKYDEISLLLDDELGHGIKEKDRNNG
ncbi:MAG: MurR/RpiR family transcriptional regulator [Clostridium sp.]|nr:MurR/RpiR family transcriptional regulator [Clostridium sp.]